MKKLKVVPYWRKMWRMWSVRLNSVGLAIMGVVFWSPDAVLAVWNMMPDAITSVLPPTTALFISMILFGASVLARIIHQEGIEDGKPKEEV